MRFCFSILLALSALIGCSSGSNGPIHPKTDLIPYYDSVNVQVSDDSIDNRFGVELGTPAQKIGNQKENIIGRIDDAIIDNVNNTLVLDSEEYEIKVYNENGRLLKSIGRRGAGPGEFESPESLSMSKGGWFIATDRNTRIQLYEPSREGYERIGSFAVGFTPEDACILNGEIYLQGFRSEHPTQSVHVYSREGNHLRSFGPVYESENVSIRYRLSSGDIACDRSTNRIIAAFELMPLIYGYTPEGTLQWTSRIRPFDPVPVEQTGRTSLKYKFGTPGGDVIQNLSDLPGPGLIVQRERVGVDVEGLWFSYWVSSKDGKGRYIGESITGSVHYATHEQLLAGPNVPFPRVEIYSVDGVDW